MHRTAARIGACLCIALLLGAGSATSELEVFERALQALEATDLERWAFVETAVRNGTTFVQRHDPTRPAGDRWLLVTVDGREPTADERERYTNRDRAADGDDPESERHEVRALISPGSVALIEETSTQLVYRFDPTTDDEDDARIYRHVDAILRIDRSGPYVASVELRSRRPFSPGFGVKLREFSMVMTFAPVGAPAEIVPSAVHVRILGRALLVKKIDERVDVRYEDYRLPAADAPGSPRPASR